MVQRQACSFTPYSNQLTCQCINHETNTALWLELSFFIIDKVSIECQWIIKKPSTVWLAVKCVINCKLCVRLSERSRFGFLFNMWPSQCRLGLAWISKLCHLNCLTENILLNLSDFLGKVISPMCEEVSPTTTLGENKNDASEWISQSKIILRDAFSWINVQTSLFVSNWDYSVV